MKGKRTPQILTITNQRGGTGKTTTAHAIGTYLTSKGYKVLFVDSDPQTALSYACGGSTADKGLLELYQESIAGKSTIDTAAAIQHTASGDLIAASATLATAEAMLAAVPAKEYRLKGILERVKNNYDAVIVDTPATLGALTANALVASDTVIAPAGAGDVNSLIGLSQLISTINTIKAYCNPALTLQGIVITRYNDRATINRQLKAQLEQYAQDNGTRLLKTVIRECTALKEATLTQQSIYQYAPKSNAAADYTALCEEILNN